MKKLLSLALLGASIVAAPVAKATGYSGGVALTFGNVSVTPTGSSIDPSSQLSSVSWTASLTTSQGTNDLALIPAFTVVTGSTSVNLNGALNPGFTLNIGTFGTFSASGAVVNVGTSQTVGTNQTYNFALVGTFTGAGVYSSYSTQSASLVFGLTSSGTGSSRTYSMSGTFATPSAVSLTPEPSSLILLGTGLVGSVGAMRRRFKA